jgi:hypothetical protein
LLVADQQLRFDKKLNKDLQHKSATPMKMHKEKMFGSK